VLVALAAVWVLMWSLACFALVSLAVAAWKNLLSDPHHAPTARTRALIASVICLPFILGELAGLGLLAWAASVEVLAVMILLVAINYVFHSLLKAPTRAGRTLIHQIEGFRQYLASAEHDRRQVRTPFLSGPMLFEKFLPYAMALNVEKVWSEKFAAALAQKVGGEPQDYSPGWYSGPAWDRLMAGDFATSLGNSFTTAVFSSTAAPRSSSGSSGSSGGGGGGGGGGGW
jgi:uncharacterized membrane protein